jgi:hypothetical protein
MRTLSIPRRLRGAFAAVVAALLVGGMFTTPAAAHIGDTLDHLFSHADQRYVRLVITDGESTGSLTSTTPSTTSSATFSVPTGGALVVIQGSVVVNNNDPGAGEGDNIAIRVGVDGSTPEQVASQSMGPEVVGGVFDTEEVETVSYVETRFLAAGGHTITQVLAAGGTGINMSFSDENLSIIVAPDGSF